MLDCAEGGLVVIKMVLRASTGYNCFGYHESLNHDIWVTVKTPKQGLALIRRRISQETLIPMENIIVMMDDLEGKEI